MQITALDQRGSDPENQAEQIIGSLQAYQSQLQEFKSAIRTMPEQNQTSVLMEKIESLLSQITAVHEKFSQTESLQEEIGHTEEPINQLERAPPTVRGSEPLSPTSLDTSAIRASSPLVRTPDIMSDLNRVAEKIEIYHKRVDEIPDASFRHGSSASILRATVTEAHKFADSQFTSLTELRENPSIGKEERSLIDRLLKSITELLAKLQKKFS